MKKAWIGTLSALVLASMLAGCNSKGLKNENALLMEENQGLRDQLNDRNAALDSAQLELRDKDQSLAQLRRDMQNQPAGGGGAATGFEGIEGVSGSFGAGEVTATVESDVLFDSGKATLKQNAKRSLDAVASVLNSSYAGEPIRITGHTDSDPIRKSGYKTNYHLGFDRAYAVFDYLKTKGVGENRMIVATPGPSKPAGTKAQSRRVEITVIVE